MFQCSAAPTLFELQSQLFAIYLRRLFFSPPAISIKKVTVALTRKDPKVVFFVAS